MVRIVALRVHVFLVYVGKVLTHIHDFIEYPLLVQVFVEIVYWVLLKSAMATGLSGLRGRWKWRLLRPLALPSFVARSALFLRRTSDVSPWSWYSDSPLSSRPQPLGSVGDDTPCEDTWEDFGLSVFVLSTAPCCRVVFYSVSPGPSG